MNIDLYDLRYDDVRDFVSDGDEILYSRAAWLLRDNVSVYTVPEWKNGKIVGFHTILG